MNLRPIPSVQLAAIGLASALSMPAVMQAQTDLPGWTLTWQDEFDGSTLNGQKWRAENAALVKNNEQQYYAPSNVTIGDGVLTILSERRAQGGRPYTSGLIESINRFSQGFGRFEARAKLPSTRGLWPAFWMLRQGGGWPPEIDIMELLGHQPTTVHMSHHWGTPQAVQSQTNAFTGPNFSEDFHTFALEWFPERLDFFVDGVLRARQTSNVPRDPMYLILNTAVGGNWPGFPDSTTILPQQMLVDYVRVWRRNLANESFEDLGPASNQPLFGWSKFGNAFVQTGGARSGARLGKMFGNFTGTANVTGIRQDAPVNPGERWRASAWWLNLATDRMQGGNSAVLKIEWLDASDAVLASAETTGLSALSPTGTFIPSSVAGTAPAGSVRLRVALLFLQPALAPGAAFVDDVFLERLSCAADFNQDGLVEPGDLDEFITAYFSASPVEQSACDFNNDGLVEPGDLDEFITAFFSPCP